MVDLLQKTLVEYYKISSPVRLMFDQIGDCEFDLDDSCCFVLEKGRGKASFHNENGSLKVLCYENFINQCKRPKSFAEGRKRCDFILCHDSSGGSFVLNEITSAYGDERNLELPILRGNPQYPGGKNQKVVDQFVHTLTTLLEIPDIRTKINSYNRKMCLMSYKVFPCNSEVIDKTLAAAYSYRKIESLETQGDGAIIEEKRINELGFEYRRISHDYSFSL